MEPHIQFAKTSDGVNIAYWAIGSSAGVPLVWMVLPSHLQAERRLFPKHVSNYDAIARITTLVRYDHRGFGLSDRHIEDLSPEALVKDLEAVVDKLGFEKFIPMAMGGFSGPVAIAYCVAHPERVERLVLGGTWVRMSPSARQRLQALIVVDNNWRFTSEAIARFMLGWDDESAARALAEALRESSSFETYKQLWQALEHWDGTKLLPRITAPTLLFTLADNSDAGVDQARALVSLLPKGRMSLAEGPAHEGRVLVYEAAITSFITGAVAARPPRDEAPPLPHGTAVILFADIAESTALTERLGDTGFRAKARKLDGALRGIIRDREGTAIEGKLLGDGVLAVFTSARQAIEAARECADVGNRDGLPLHLGLHAGDVIREEGNVYGGAVNIAARISGLSAPGEVLVSDIVRGLARTSAGVSFDGRGEQRLKGVSDSVRVWAVKPAASAPASEPYGAKGAYPDHLTDREVEVLRLIAAGRTNAEISLELVISKRTLARHITNIYGKIGARSKVDAAAYATRHDLTHEK